MQKPPKNLDEALVSLIYKSIVITVYQNEIDGKFMPSIRLPNEAKDRLLDLEGADTIARAVKLARSEIDKLP
jgi:hypothetical protein